MSDPEIFESYANELLPGYSFHDVYSIVDLELLNMVPRPVEALLICFNSEISKLFQDQPAKNVYWTPQIIKNACGTIGIIHCLANSSKAKDLKNDNQFLSLIRTTFNLDTKERAIAIAENKNLRNLHSKYSTGNNKSQSHFDTDYHYVAMVKKEKQLVLLDGRQQNSIILGLAESNDLLNDECLKILKKFLMKIENAKSNNFSILAMVLKK